MANGRRIVRTRNVFIKDDIMDLCEYLMRKMNIKIRVDYVEDLDELETKTIKSFYIEHEKCGL